VAQTDRQTTARRIRADRDPDDRPELSLSAGEARLHGLPLPGTEVAVIDDGNRLLGAGEPGTLAIKLPNPQLMLGYWRAPS